ncbi:MAG: GNAT family N-acetyltransferase [Lachnospiraceae bacterium]|nr:GNAT family N-acetyltransferase [Lachnospiraceae bacterium]
MNIEVKKLDSNMADEYLTFFDQRAFSDGSAEKGCYCVWHHWTDKHEQERSLMPENERPYRKRNYAKELIRNGTLNGFAAFCEEQIVGFCNADTKDHYFRLSRENQPDSWIDVNENDKILAIVCFIVAPDMRRKGVAKALLECACQYAQENGYDYVEGYPSKGEFVVNNCGGSASMYMEQGFEIVDVPGGIIARKKMKRPQEP